MGRIWSTVPTVARRRLAWGAAAAVAVPVLLGEIVKQFGVATGSGDAMREAQIVDFIVIGAVIFGLTMVGTVLFGVVLVSVMKGPRHRGDAFPDEP